MSLPTVLITGCSEGGIGAGLATGFAARGYHVYAAVRNPLKAGSLADVPNITVIKLDITNAESVQSVAAELATQLPEGKLDILINNAGMGTTGPIIEADLAVMRQVYDVNVFGPLAVTQALVPMLIKAKGKVVNICSTAGIVPLAWKGVYHSSKSAANMLSEIMRLELAPLGVTVLTGVIGGVQTKFFSNEVGLGLSESSRYKSIESDVFKIPSPEDGFTFENLDTFVDHLIGDIVRGATGPVYRGFRAQTARLLAYHVPISVSDRLVRYLGGLNKLESHAKTK